MVNRELVGKVFGMYTVISQDDNPSEVRWWCRCEGCLQRDNLVARSITHGMSDTGEWRSWSSMRSRCTLQTNDNWGNYGGRGIRVCERWMNSFENFLADMGPRPTSKHTIERNNVNGDYEPGNCHWADRLEQTRNRRNTKTANYKGEEHHLADLAKLAKVSYRIFHGRLARGWSVDEAVEGRPPLE